MLLRLPYCNCYYKFENNNYKNIIIELITAEMNGSVYLSVCQEYVFLNEFDHKHFPSLIWIVKWRKKAFVIKTNQLTFSLLSLSLAGIWEVRTITYAKQQTKM